LKTKTLNLEQMNNKEQTLNDPQKQQLNIPAVSGMLPMYDVEELNEIVSKLNSGEINLYDCIGRVWNKAYFIGANEGMKAGSLGNYR
jgi:hypothetical protein